MNTSKNASMHASMHASIRLLAAVLLGAGPHVHAATLDIAVSDEQGRPLPDAVAWLKPASGTASQPAAAPFAIDQINRRFVPSVSVVSTGTSVRFPNSDNVRHSVYSFSPAKTFTLKLYSGVPAEPVLFDKPGLVTLGCNIHDTMLAYVKVVDTPYFGKSAADGQIRVNGLPAGHYQLALWHPWLAGAEPVQALQVDAAGSKTRVTLSLKAPGGSATGR